MKKYRIKHYIAIIIASWILSDFAENNSRLSAQQGLKPAEQNLQNELMKNFVNTGYGDYELDLIHQKLALLLPKLKPLMEKDANGDECLKLEISSGESIHSDGDHYLVYGYAYLYPDAEVGKLKKITLEYFRQNASGASYSVEKRELVNPTPVFKGENIVDSNSDIILSYSLSTKSDKNFKKIRSTTLGEIDRHDRKKKLIGAYKDYLRKTLFALQRNITDLELAKVTELLYMLEFE